MFPCAPFSRGIVMGYLAMFAAHHNRLDKHPCGRRVFEPSTGARPVPRGFTVTELTIVVAIIAVSTLATAPLARRAYMQHQANAAVNQVQSLVQKARMSAIKEKVSYRLVVHNENATVPNILEIQRKQGNSFLTQDTYDLPESVQLLSGSVGSLTVSSQGTCSTGNVYVQASDGAYKTVSIKSTCLTEKL